MTNIFIDIETVPTQPEEEAKVEIAKTIQAPAAMKKEETIADWHNGAGKYASAKDKAIEDAYLKTSFDGAKGHVVSIAFSDGKDMRCEYDSLKSDIAVAEHEILTEAFYQIVMLCEKKKHNSEPFFIGHNVSWDLKFMWQRAVILGVEPDFKLPFSGRHEKDFFDNQQAWAGYKKFTSQDNLCKALGIEGKPDDIDGSQVWDFVKRGDIKRVAEYNVDDVEKCIQIYNRINFIGA